MTVKLGPVTVATFQGVSSCLLVTPSAFDTAQALRLTNLSTDVVVLTNISDTYQGQEYLMPGQQMVYKSPNRSGTPTAVGLTLTPTQLSTLLFAEWSDDAETDFIGTYPTTCGSGIVSPDGSVLIS